MTEKVLPCSSLLDFFTTKNVHCETIIPFMWHKSPGISGGAFTEALANLEEWLDGELAEGAVRKEKGCRGDVDTVSTIVSYVNGVSGIQQMLLKIVILAIDSKRLNLGQHCLTKWCNVYKSQLYSGFNIIVNQHFCGMRTIPPSFTDVCSLYNLPYPACTLWNVVIFLR